ncbi:Uncharacterised protein [Mycobacteroides abscessus subsp. massiliense]|nr:Uncharacterised protein [Mycobacteroides abscessus subsp. massiliense]
MACIENPKLKQHKGIGDEGEGRERNRQSEVVSGSEVEIAVREQRRAHRRPGDRHHRHHRNQHGHRQPGCQRHIAEHGRSVLSGSIATQPGHDRGEDRDADNPVRQLQDHPGLAIDDRAGFRGTGGDPVRDDIPELTDGHVREHGGGHSAELLEAVVEPPQGAQGNLLAPNRRQQHHGLGRNTERGADAQYQQLRVAHPDWVEGELTRHQPVQHQGADRHQVVPYRRPSGRAKHVAGVQNRHEQ